MEIGLAWKGVWAEVVTLIQDPSLRPKHMSREEATQSNDPDSLVKKINQRTNPKQPRVQDRHTARATTRA